MEKLTDDNIWFMGKHDGKRLGDIPVSYWKWVLETMSRLRPDIKEYAEGRIKANK